MPQSKAITTLNTKQVDGHLFSTLTSRGNSLGLKETQAQSTSILGFYLEHLVQLYHQHECPTMGKRMKFINLLLLACVTGSCAALPSLAPTISAAPTEQPTPTPTSTAQPTLQPSNTLSPTTAQFRYSRLTWADLWQMFLIQVILFTSLFPSMTSHPCAAGSWVHLWCII